MNDGEGTQLVIDADRKSKRSSGATDMEVIMCMTRPQGLIHGLSESWGLLTCPQR